MTERDNGGPAFPEIGNVGYNSDWLTESGMSLRDWFAGQALAAIIIGNKADAVSLTFGAAKDAYTAADAMLEARK